MVRRAVAAGQHLGRYRWPAAMSTAIYQQLLLVVVASAYLRGAGVLLAFLRTFLGRRRFVTFRMGWVEVVCFFEPLVLLEVAYALHAGGPAAPTLGRLCAALAGAVLALAGWGLLLWSIASWRGLVAGHGVLADHRLVTRGAYGFVRHPVYLAAFLIWLGLAIGFLSRTAFLVTVFYVVPIYQIGR